jgi:hypothetical protein
MLYCMVYEFCKRVNIPFTGKISDRNRFPLNDCLILKDIIEELKMIIKKSDWLIRVEFTVS